MPKNQTVNLDTPCLICGSLNRFHEAFFNADGYYIRQIPAEQDIWLQKNMVRSRDHYFCFDNLEYLEYLNAQKE